MRRSASSLTVLAASAAALSFAPQASSDIIGFDNFAQWSYNQGDAGSPPNFIDEDYVEFTTGTNNRRSVWFNVPQDITGFTASFTYRASEIAASTHRQGITFAIQNDGLGAVGGVGNGLGYSGIAPSAAVTIETQTSGGRTYSGFYRDGIVGTGSEETTPVNAFTGADIDVTIVYAGSVMSVSMTQGSNVAPIRNYFVGSLESIVGDSTAWVGFTGGTFNTLGGQGGARQFISDFRFTVPEPSSALGLIGLVAFVRRWR